MMLGYSPEDVTRRLGGVVFTMVLEFLAETSPVAGLGQFPVCFCT